MCIIMQLKLILYLKFVVIIKEKISVNSQFNLYIHSKINIVSIYYNYNSYYDMRLGLF